MAKKAGERSLGRLEIEDLTEEKIEGFDFSERIICAARWSDPVDNCVVFLASERDKNITFAPFEKLKGCLAIVPAGLVVPEFLSVIRCERPRQVWSKIVRYLYDYENSFLKCPCNETDRITLHQNVWIHPTAQIANGTEIGANSIIQAGVVIGPKTKIGKNTLVMHGSIIGGQGFGADVTENGVDVMPHIGGVLIGDNCSVGAGTIIDAGTITETVISNHVATGSLVHIAHNVEVGENCRLAARSGLSGSVKIGRNVFVGAGAMVRDGVTIGDHAFLGMMTAVIDNVPDNCTVVGVPGRIVKNN